MHGVIFAREGVSWDGFCIWCWRSSCCTIVLKMVTACGALFCLDLNSCWTMKANVVKLDVGGTHYTTSRDTLCMDPNSVLHTMFSGQFAEPHKDPETGRVFIDRKKVPNYHWPVQGWQNLQTHFKLPAWPNFGFACRKREQNWLLSSAVPRRQVSCL